MSLGGVTGVTRGVTVVTTLHQSSVGTSLTNLAQSFGNSISMMGSIREQYHTASSMDSAVNSTEISYAGMLWAAGEPCGLVDGALFG